MKGKWFAFGCLTSVIIIVALIFSLVFSIGKLGDKIPMKKVTKKISEESFLHVSLSGPVSEYNELEDDFAGILGDEKTGAHEIIQKIILAANDKNIKGIFFEPKNTAIGLATANEINGALKYFRDSGKPVHCYLEFAGNRDYFLASASDQIYLNPSSSAGIMLTGLGTNIHFYKDLLDKIGVEMQVIHAGKYKGAGEPYVRNKISAPFKESIEELFDDIYNQMLKTIASNRQISVKEIKDIYEKRDDIFVNQDRALNYKLVDELAFREDVLNKLDIRDDNLISLSNYGSLKLDNNRLDKVAVVYALGTIANPTSSLDSGKLYAKKLNKILDDIKDNKTIKALVLRVDSPGGSALESEIMLTKIKEIRQHIPVIISMANVAASGGYYIACESDYIMVDPFTITGSIGVVAMFPNISKLTDKVGIHSNVITKGKFSNILDPTLPPNKEVLASVKRSIGRTYDEFKNHVANGRGMDMNAVEEIAQGRIWSSADAIEVGLADGLGGMNEAIEKAKELANITDYSLKYFPEKSGMLERVIKDRFDIDIEKAVTRKFAGTKELRKVSDFLECIKSDPIQAIIPIDPEL
jgi:protease IV